MGYHEGMRGDDIETGAGLCVIDLEQWIPQEHPLRRLRAMLDEALHAKWAHFEALYAKIGRPSIPPERLIRALFLQVVYSVRSETQLMEQITYNLLYRWFVGLGADGKAWDPTVFTKNRERLLSSELAQRLLEAVVDQARAHDLLSEEHFTVDGTMIEAWAGRKSFGPKQDPPDKGTGCRGRKCLRDTHESKTDPESRLYKKSTAGEVKPCYLGHVIIENRRGLVIAACGTQADKRAERKAGLAMLDQLGLRPSGVPPGKNFTVGADKAYQERDFVQGLRERHIAPHVAEYATPSANRPNYLSEGERNDPRFSISQSKRKLVEMIFGWGKGDSIMRKTKLRGLKAVDWLIRFLAMAYDLVRMVKLIPAQP